MTDNNTEMDDFDLPPPPPPPVPGGGVTPITLPPSATSDTSSPEPTPSPPPPPPATDSEATTTTTVSSKGPPPIPAHLIRPPPLPASVNSTNGGPPPLPNSTIATSSASTVDSVPSASINTSSPTNRSPSSSVSTLMHTSSSPSKNVAGSGGVSQLTAMLQATMSNKSSANNNHTTIPEVNDSDSDTDDSNRNTAAPNSPGTFTMKLSTASGTHHTLHSSSSFSTSGTYMKWEVEKANRYGLKESRILVLDLAGHAVRFFEREKTSEKLKSEVPLNQISVAARKTNGEEPKRVEMQFKEDRRPYELYFKSEDEAKEFERLLSAEIDQNSLPMTRAYSASIQRNMIPISTPSPSSTNSHHSFSTPASPAHPHHHAASSNSSLGVPSHHHGRDASESVAILSEVGVGLSPKNLQPQEDHNAYLDYPVSKKNRYGMRQQRILVINATGCTMLLLDEKRKFKKEFHLSSILSVEIPKTKDSDKVEAQCFLIFTKESGQKPFHLFFGDALDRLHFCERLVSLAPHNLSIKDESDHVEDSDSFRFAILKINKVGVKKKRIVVLRTKERVLRSFNHEKSYKDVKFASIVKWEKPHLDRFRLNIYLLTRSHPLIFVFPDPVARERFVVQCNYIRSVMEEESLPTSTITPSSDSSSTVSPASPATTAPASLNPPLSIFIGSWNLGNAPFTYESLSDFIPSMKYDLYVIGLQECSKSHRDQWLLELRNHIQQNWKSSSGGSSSTNSVEDDKDDSEQPYALLGVVKLWEIVMMVLIRRPLASKVSNLCMDTIATGLGDVLANKGGCGLSFTYQETNLCFVACHLAARSERIVQRAENYMKILRQLQLGLPNVDILSQNDHVFWLGDLNYRNELEFSEVLQLVKMKDWKLLCTYDQLTAQMAKQLVFAGFQEAPLRFAPTYRWERKENVFSNKKFQAPSWTDRVLWHSLPGLADLKLESYSSAPNVMGSDHRPIFATFQLSSRAAYTGKLSRNTNLQPIHLMNNENRNLVKPDNVAFTAIAKLEPTATAPPTTPAKSASVALPLTSPKSNNLLIPGSLPTTSTYHHFSLAAPASNGTSSLQHRPSATPNNSGVFPPATAASTMKGFTPYQFTAPPPGPLYTPPIPNPCFLSEKPTLLGSTKVFSIVLQDVKCTFSNVPRGDFTLTASAPFLQSWPTTTAVSYPFGLEVGCHWDEIVLPPFIHDLYYLYTRHLLFSISVPSLAASTSGQNVEQTGMGTCIGTVSVSLGSICANIFELVSTMPPVPAVAKFNPLAPPPPNSGLGATQPVNPNSPGLTGDHGAYYFVEPIYREGLYAGQMEGRIQFRYTAPEK